MQLQTFGAWTGSVSGIGAGALTASPEYQFLAPYLAFVSAAVWVALLLWFLISNRREIRAGVGKLGSWYFILPCLALGIIAVASAAYGLGLRSTTPPTPNKGNITSTQVDERDANFHTIIKNPHIEGMLGPNGFLALTGEAAEHITRARIVVEVKYYIFQKWNERTRIEISPIIDKLKGDKISVPLTHYVEQVTQNSPQHHYWGDPKENFPVHFGPMLIRILVTNAKGEDQAPFDFVAFRATDTLGPMHMGGIASPYPIYLLEGADADWKKQWEVK